MRLLIIVLLNSFFLSTAQAQYQYVDIYRNGIMGVMFLEQNKYDSAELYLTRALDLTPEKLQYPQYLWLTRLAWMHHDTLKTQKCLKALSCIYPKDSVLTYLNDYEGPPMARQTFDMLYKPDCQLKQEKSPFPWYPEELDTLIMKMRDRDQAVRRKANNYKGERTEEWIKKMEQEMKDVDSLNFIDLKYAMEYYHLPHLRGNLQGSFVTLVMHIDNYHRFYQVHKFLLRSLTEGNFCPTHYAYAFDRSLMASGLSPHYYWFIPGSADAEKYKPAPEDVPRVNAAREAIGLPPYPAWTGWSY